MSVFWLERPAGSVPSHQDWLAPAERECLAGMRFLKRRADWLLGRWTAKCAVAAISAPATAFADIEILPATSGAPVLRIRGHPAAVAISISHRAGLACCAIGPHPQALGCDLEVVEPRSPAFVRDYLTAGEAAWIERAPPEQRPRLIALLWSAKESALKALGIGLRADTRSVAIANLRQVGAVPPCDRAWHPLAVRSDASDFTGIWQSSAGFVRTVVYRSFTCARTR